MLNHVRDNSVKNVTLNDGKLFKTVHEISKNKKCFKKHSGVKWAGVEVLWSRQADLQQTVNFSHHYQGKHRKVYNAMIWRWWISDKKGRRETMKKSKNLSWKVLQILKCLFRLFINMSIWFHSHWHSEILNFSHHITCMHRRFYCSSNNLVSFFLSLDFSFFKLLYNVMLTFFTETIFERGLGSRFDMKIRKMVVKKVIWPWNVFILIVLSSIYLKVLLSALVVVSNMMCNIWIQLFLPLPVVLKVASVRVHCTLLLDFFPPDNGIVGGVWNKEWKLKVMQCSQNSRKNWTEWI